MVQDDPDDSRDPQTYAIIGAAMEVHRELGCGFLERVYREPFSIELAARNIPFVREIKFPIIYKHRVMPVAYRVDFICYGAVLVEIKALPAIGPLEHAQVINYCGRPICNVLFCSISGRAVFNTNESFSDSILKVANDA